MTNPEFHTCPDCGYKWRHGQHGGHSCAVLLIKQRDELLRELISARNIIFELQGAISGKFFEPQIAAFDAAISKAGGTHEQP